jgi:hypothetical protein
MTTITDRDTGRDHHGRSVESIVRRIYGRRAGVGTGDRTAGGTLYTVTEPDPSGSRRAIGRIAVADNDR